MVKAEKAFKDPSYTPSGGSAGDLETGSTLVSYTYDGLNRRISRERSNCGPLSAESSAFEYWYADNRVIEETFSDFANYSDKRYVWGLTYIDELITVEVVDEFLPNAYESYYAILDSKYCVMGLVDSNGDWVERYEYTPDGRRQVYITAGTNDPDAQTPTSEAPRRTAVASGTTYLLENAICTIGFQGLRHDEITGNVWQRTREYSTRLGRFTSRTSTARSTPTA